MNSTLFTVTPAQLSSLDSTRATNLVASLLWAEARTIGLATTKVSITTRINVADGGVDASIDTSSALNPGWATFIPTGRTIFQIKAGSSFKPWQESEIKNELFGRKPPSRDNL